MQRIIKFRAWDLDSEKMITPNEDGEYIWNFANGQVVILANVEYAKEVGGEVEFVNDWLPVNFELMQFTGLTDKNNSGSCDIYEGDCVSLKGIVIGNIYEKMDKGEPYIIIPKITSRDWVSTYEILLDSGCEMPK